MKYRGLSLALRPALAALALGALAAGCGSSSTTDTGVTTPAPDAAPADSGSSKPDAEVLPPDSGLPLPDSGVPPADTGVPPADTGVPPADSGADAGVVEDSGPDDTGTQPLPDSGAAGPILVHFIAPNANQTLAGSVTLRAQASSDLGITEVEFFAGATSLGVVPSAPYQLVWDTTTALNGSYVLRVRASDNDNRTAFDTRAVVVANPNGRNIPPSVAFTAPSGTGSICGAVVVEAVAADPDDGVARVDFYADGAAVGTARGFPYRATWTTAGVLNGAHILGAIATDTRGAAAQANLLVDVQNSGAGCDVAPVVNLTAPTARYLKDPSVMISATASDDMGIAHVVFFVDTMRLSEATASPYTATWNASASTEGPHAIRAVASDTGIQSTETALPVIVDRTPPRVSITDPAPNATISTTYTITATAADLYGVDRVVFSADGTTIATTTIAPYSASVTLTTGAHTLRAVAYDRAGNSATAASVSVTAARPPTVAITAPAANTVVRGAIPISATASDMGSISDVRFYADTTLIATVTNAPYVTTWNPNSFMNGRHRLAAVARNSMGVTGRAEVSVDLELRAPSISITAPANNAVVRGTITVTASAAADAGIAQVEFLRGATSLGVVTAAPYLIMWNTSPLTNGTYALVARATDRRGVTSQATIQVRVDDQPPTVMFTSPDTGNSLRSNITIALTAADDIRVVSVVLSVDTSTLATFTMAPYTLPYDTTVLSNGAHTFHAIATDTKGQTATADLPVVIQDDPPAVTLTSPGDMTMVRGPITISANASDDVSLRSVVFYYDTSNVIMRFTPPGPYTINWDTLAIPNGAHTISAVGTDSKNQSTTSEVQIIVADAAPVVAITTPMTNAVVSGAIPLAATATDDLAVIGVDFNVGGTRVARFMSPPYATELNTCLQPEGARVFQVNAADYRSQVGTDMVTLQVANHQAPAILTAVASASNGAPAVNLGFSTVCSALDVTRWNLFYGMAPGISTLSSMYTVNDANFTDTSLVPGANYYYRLQPVYAGTPGALSDEVLVPVVSAFDTEGDTSFGTAVRLTGGGGLVAGGLFPAGNQDYFTFDVMVPGYIAADVGIPVPGACSDPQNETILRLYNSDQVELGSDTNGGVAPCSSIDPRIHAFAAVGVGTYFIRIEQRGNTDTISQYTINIRNFAGGCGNGVLEPQAPFGETCDDGNLLPGDGCSGTCQFEGQPEVEPNDTAATANAITTNPGLTAGAIRPVGDMDVWSIVVPQGSHLSADLRVGAWTRCLRDPLTRLELLAPNGTTVLATGTAPDSGEQTGCPHIGPDNFAQARAMAAGTYYLRVSKIGNNAVVPRYYLHTLVQAPGCGNGVVEAGEQCDDGNATSLDGCSSTCQVELAGTITGRTGAVTMNIPLPGQFKTVRLDLAAAGTLDATTGDVTGGGCAVDTTLKLYDSTFRLVGVATSGGAGAAAKCAVFGQPRDTFAANLAAGTYYLEVFDAGLVGGTTRLGVTVRP